MILIFKKNPNIKIEAPVIKTIKATKDYGWYKVEGCDDGRYENILGPLSMAFWELINDDTQRSI